MLISFNDYDYDQYDHHDGHNRDDVTDLDALVAGVDADHEADEHLCPVASQEAGQQHSNQTCDEKFQKLL